MALNMNVEPYNDDFSPEKNFHRILFKPGVAVQARELTQSQTILQNQISNFASSIFSQNTPVSGGNVTTNLNCNYLKLNKTYYNLDIKASNFLNKTITDSTGTILAKVIAVSEATNNGTVAGDPPTLIVNYISGTYFSDNMILSTTDGSNYSASTIGVDGNTISTGKSSVASISTGVFYVINGYNTSTVANGDGSFNKYSIGNFVTVPQQTIILNKYDNVPSSRIGLNISETIVDYLDDSSLLDPAIGASNYQAPGADRYSISLKLISYPLSLGNDDNFIELVRIKNGSIIKQINGTSYSAIDDYFAKRTFDTNGDYLVHPFKLTPAKHPTDPSKFKLGISKGTAYVRGYRLENQSALTVSGNRATNSDSLTRNGVSIDYGTYFYVDNVLGSSTSSFDITRMQSIDLHSVPLANVVTSTANTYNSTLVGTAKIRNLEFDTSVVNTSSYIYKASVFDIASNVLSSNVSSSDTTTNSITFYDPTGKFSTKNDAYTNVTLTLNGYQGKIISYNGSTKTANLNIAFPIQPTASDTFSIKFDIKDVETLLSVDGSRNILSSAKIATKSKVDSLPSGDTKLFDAGYPELLFRIGNPYVKSTSNATFESTSLFRDQPFTTISSGVACVIQFDTYNTDVLNFKGRTSTQLSNDEVLKYYTVIVKNKGSNSSLTNGQILDFTSATGTRNITVDVSLNKITLFSSDLSAATTFTVDVIAKVFVNNASDSSHVLKTKKLITTNTSIASISGTVVNTNTFVTLTETAPTNAQVYIKNGGIVVPRLPQSLYISDVKRIVKIIDTQSPSTIATSDMISSSVYDVTNNYTFSNGQNDNYYDHASITLKAGAPAAKGNLLVLLDCYVQGGGDGYFDVSSYTTNSTLPENYAEIPNYTASNGNIYPLRDCLDFRPVRKNATSTFVFNYTTPSSQESGMYIPDNLTNFICDYSYYLARKDLLVLSKSKNFSLITGVPAINPSYPSEPDGALLIAKINLDPYTAYVPGENPAGTLPNLSVETIQHKRWTMQDISNIQTQINDLNYYTALNSLEQTATSMQVPDSNGLNRFKNGILVDDFSSFSTSDTSNPDWSANINKRTRQLSAMQTVTNFPLQNSVILAGGNAPSAGNYKISKVNESTNIFTLPYTISSVAVQQLASNTINVNPFGVAITQGILDINPPMDNWVDNTKEPDLLIVDPSLQVFQQSSSVNVLAVGDWKTVPGTTATSVSTLQSAFSRVNHGAFFGPFGSVVGYTQTDTTTTTSTYGTKSQENTLGYYSNIGNTYSLNNNYLTDISILPYIRPQQLLIKSKGLLVNTPVSTWFDGTKVDQYMTAPDIIELTNVSGTFKAGDTVGYYDNNKFNPIASVVDVYSNDSSSTRLYVVGNYHSSYQADSSISRIQNGFYDDSGNYSTTTASGQISAANIISIHKAGYIGAVGGTFTDLHDSTLRYYRVRTNYGSFADQFGIWGSPNSRGELPAGLFNFTAPSTGTYIMRVSTDDNQSGYIKIDTVSKWTSSLQSGGHNDISLSLTKGTHTFEIYMKNSEEDGDSYAAVAITSGTWLSDTTTNGQIILSTDSLKANTVPLNGGTQIEMPGGGLYYVGATQVSLNGIANSVDEFYTNSTITFNTVQISLDVFGKSIVTPEVYTSTITHYDGANCTCTLSSPVNLSVGGNAIIGGSDTTSFYSINGTISSYQLSIQKGKLDKLSTDESGTFIGVFNVPGNTFKTGERVFRIDNRLIDNDQGSSTTFSEGTFTASGLSTRSQSLDFSPSVSGARNTFKQTSYLSNQLISTDTKLTTSYSPYDPVAQSFMIPINNYPNGVFLDSISLYFITKPKNSSPITLSIIGTLNGYPNGETLDYSIVTLSPDQVNISSNPHYLDPASITTFKFSAPVYIHPGVLYAFILKSSSTEYNLFCAAQNAIAIPSSTKVNYTDPNPTNVTKIGNSPYFGSIFESQNSITWTADQTKSLMMTLNRCVFDTNSEPKIPFTVSKQLSFRKQLTNNIKNLIDANTFSNILYSHSGVDVLSDAYNITTTHFTPNSTGVAYSYISTLNNTKGYTSETSIIPGVYGCPTFDDVYLSDGKGQRTLLAKTDNSFLLYGTLKSSDDAVSPIISDDGVSLYNIEWSINNLELSNNRISILNEGSGYSNIPNISISAPDVLGGTQAYAYANVTSGFVDSIKFSNVGSGYLKPPTITISGTNTTQASAVAISEFSPSGGNAICKYFTKKVVLTPDNNSQDLRVFYTAYKPSGSNIYVFYKLLNQNDPSKFDDNSWQLMTTVGQNKNVYSLTRNDLYEFEAAPGSNGTADNIISYINKNGQTYNSFIQFSIKIVMTTSDKTTVPFLTDIRAMALPKGTSL